jgi:hypothetical protein
MKSSTLKKKSERRSLFSVPLLSLALVFFVLLGCSDAPEDPPSTAAQMPTEDQPDADVRESAQAETEPAKETRWTTAVFAGINGEFGGLGKGTLTEDENGKPIALGIEYHFDNVKSRLVMRNGRIYLGADDGSMRWLDVTDPVGQLQQVSTQLLREEDDDYVRLREQTYGGERFTVFGKMGEIVALDESTAIGSRYLHWKDDSGEIRRHVSIVTMRSGDDTVALISVADRDDTALLPDWYDAAARTARFNSVRAAPALRYSLTMGGPQAAVPDHDTPSYLEIAFSALIPQAHAQSFLSSVLQDLLEQVEGDLEDALIGDFLDNFPPPGSDLSDYLTQLGLSGYEAIKNYFTPEQMRVLARSAIENVLKKVVEQSLLRIAPYLGVYGLAAMVAGWIVDDIIDFFTSNVHGEPHINGFDGVRYSFQAIGEFVYFTTPGFEVQQRFTGEKGRASSAQATAIRVGDNVIESYFDSPSRRTSDMPIVVNGDDVTLTRDGISFDDGGFVGRLKSKPTYHNLIVVEPGGSYVIVENLNVSQNVLFGVSEDIRALIAGGLGGVPDGDRANDFALRDGTILDSGSIGSIENMYGRFAASWRVTPEERLFTRGTAQEFLTAEYTDLPASVAKLSDYSDDEQERARRTCIDAGVLGEAALEDCTYDVLVTGDPAWAQAAGASQVVMSMVQPADLEPAPAAVRREPAPDLAPVSVTLTAVAAGVLDSTELQWILIKQATEETSIPESVAATIDVMLKPGRYDVIISSDNFTAESTIDVAESGNNRFDIPLQARSEEQPFDAPASAPAGEVLRFGWRGPGLENDVIFIASPSMRDNRYPRSNRHDAADPSDAVLITPAIPGNYEIRYFSHANGTVLARQPIAITAPRVEIEAPQTVTAGSEFVFSWTGPGIEGDLLFVARSDMDANQYFRGGRSMAASGGNGRFVAPAEPGDYEIRYFSMANGAALFRRPLTVTDADVRWRVPAEIVAAAEFSFEFSGPGLADDRLFIATPEMDANRYYTDSDRSHKAADGATATLIAPVSAGDYEIRYFSGAAGGVLARYPIAVSEHAVTIDAPRTVDAGTEFEVHWTGPKVEGDFLFLTEPSLEPTKYYYGDRLRKVDVGSPARFTAPTESGPFEIRYYSKKNGRMVAKRTFVVR